jgi:hypothetical protein
MDFYAQETHEERGKFEPPKRREGKKSRRVQGKEFSERKKSVARLV